ncbi:MAG: HAD-IIB family hydrolase [Candidatus Pacebacteria bacterium]|nr:HAD-IIB family hydrolase [Candidatus Paceibacterota bacterium]
MNKLIIFDLDGTLTESKQPLTATMALLLSQLLSKTPVAIISGGAFSQFLKQVIALLPVSANLANLYILPTSGAALYEYRNDGWEKIYEERLSEKDKDTIETAMLEAAKETGTINWSDQSWGERIEYRGGQVTMSALGQQAPIVLKKAWDPNHAKRHKLQEALATRLSGFSVGIGGATSIDVSKRGVDKAYGLRKLCERLGLKESDALYVGDELEKGGNDEAVYKTEAHTKAVKDPLETERYIKSLLNA